MRKIYLLILCCGASATGMAQKLAPAAFKKFLDSASNEQLIDVRTPAEFAAGHITSAVNIDIYNADFLQALQGLQKKKPVLVYCKAGGRSADAAAQLKRMGFATVIDLQGGIMLWEKENLPLVEATEWVDKSNLFTAKHFDSVLAQHPNLLVDFYAHWCGPCKQMEPSLQKLAKKYKNITVYRVNVDEAKALARDLGISALPYVALYKDGKLVKAETGLLSYQELKEFTQQLLSTH